MNDNPQDWLDEALAFGYIDPTFINDIHVLIGGVDKVAIAKATIQQHFTAQAKAYGGCTNCYGKGYATVNDQWLAHDTDQDIGSPGGYISGGDANAMKFCTCERGQQLKARFKKQAKQHQIDLLKARVDELHTEADIHRTSGGKGLPAAFQKRMNYLKAELAKLEGEKQHD